VAGLEQPVVSVVLSSDYASGKAAGWDDLRSSLAGLARQDFDGTAEFLLVESAELVPQIPADVLQILPALRVIGVPAKAASELKNAGARAAGADIVAMIDADCTPVQGWLRHVVTALRNNPDVEVVSGRTSYGRRTLLDRVMALITRSFLDEGRTAPTRHVTINNAAFRRATFLKYPLPDVTGAHMSMLQSEAIARDGGHFLFEPGMHVTHNYEGWAMEKEIRRSMGYGVIKVRRLDRRMPHAWMARQGFFSVPLFVMLRTLHSCWNCMRRAADYGVKWYELPIAFILAGAACCMEAPGMWRAVRDLPHGPSEFR
jgi:hypothetical protein